MTYLNETFQDGTYEDGLKRAVVSTHSEKVNAYIIACGDYYKSRLAIRSTVNSEDEILSKTLSERVPFKFCAIRAYYVRIHNNTPMIVKCILISPVSNSEYLIWDLEAQDLAIITARLLSFRSKNLDGKWSIPLYVLPYFESAYKFGNLYTNKNIRTDCVTDFMGSFDSYTFGQEYGKCFKYDGARFKAEGLSDNLMSQFFILKDLPDSCNVCDIPKLFRIYYSLISSKVELKSAKETPDDILSCYVECMGDSMFEHVIDARIDALPKGNKILLCLEETKQGYKAVFLKCSFKDDVGLTVKLQKVDLSTMLRDGILGYGVISQDENEYRFRFLDRTIVFDRGRLNDIVGSFATAKTYQTAMRSQLTYSSSGMELCGDGTLISIDMSAEGRIVIPREATALERYCIHPTLAQLKEIKSIAFHNNIKKIHSSFLYVDRALRNGSCKYILERGNLTTNIRILSTLLRVLNYHEVRNETINLELYTGNKDYNVELLTAYLLIQYTTTQTLKTDAVGVPRLVQENGLGTYIGREQAVAILDTVYERIHKKYMFLAKASTNGYSAPEVCADSDKWSSLFSFSLSQHDFLFKVMLTRVTNALVVHYKDLLSEEQYNAYLDKLTDYWAFLVMRMLPLVKYCIACHKKLFFVDAGTDAFDLHFYVPQGLSDTVSAKQEKIRKQANGGK